MLDTRIKDPRLGFVTVTDVRVTGDLQHASVFYTVLGDEEARADSAAALASAKGLIRSEVGKQTGIRLTPTLEFIADAIPETAAAPRGGAAASLPRATPRSPRSPRRPSTPGSPTRTARPDDEPGDDEPGDEG